MPLGSHPDAHSHFCVAPARLYVRLLSPPWKKISWQTYATIELGTPSSYFLFLFYSTHSPLAPGAAVTTTIRGWDLSIGTQSSPGLFRVEKGEDCPRPGILPELSAILNEPMHCRSVRNGTVLQLGTGSCSGYCCPSWSHCQSESTGTQTALTGW